jgi:putative endonuclease
VFWGADVRNRRSEGARYEELACSYLKKKGYKIIDRNVYLLRKEVDVIALDRDTVVFIEVKGRRSARYGMPSEAVDARKQKHMIKIAGAYLEKMRMPDRACRFDVVSVKVGSDKHMSFEHVEGAFEA